MPRGGKDGTTKVEDVRPLGETANDTETFGEALSRAGLEPAKVGRKIVSQGKHRETLKKRVSKKPDK